VVTLTAADLAALVREQLEAALAENAPIETPTDGLLDRAGAARWLKVSLAKLDGLCRREADPLPFSVCGDSRRFEREELRAWVRRQRGNR
jgi:hypothetical protein